MWHFIVISDSSLALFPSNNIINWLELSMKVIKYAPQNMNIFKGT